MSGARVHVDGRRRGRRGHVIGRATRSPAGFSMVKWTLARRERNGGTGVREGGEPSLEGRGRLAVIARGMAARPRRGREQSRQRHARHRDRLRPAIQELPGSMPHARSTNSNHPMSIGMGFNVTIFDADRKEKTAEPADSKPARVRGSLGCKGYSPSPIGVGGVSFAPPLRRSGAGRGRGAKT